MKTHISDTFRKWSLKTLTAAVLYLLSSPVDFGCDDKTGASEEDRVKINTDNFSSKDLKCFTSSLFSW